MNDQSVSVSQSYEWMQEYEKKKKKILGSVANELKATNEGVKSPLIKEEGKSRVDKMKEIKNEIKSLIGKLECTSKSIGSSFKLETTPPKQIIIEPIMSVKEDRKMKTRVEEKVPIRMERENSFLHHKLTQLESGNKLIPRPNFIMSQQNEDTYALKKNIEELELNVKKKEVEKEQLMEELERIKNAHQEYDTQKEVNYQTLKLENKDLRTKIKILEEQSTSAEIIEVYNRDIEKLNKRIGDLWSDLVQVKTDNIHLPSTVNIKEAAFKKTLDGLRRLIRKMEKTIKEVDSENSELKKERRKWNLHEKLLADATKKANTMKIEKDRTDTLNKELQMKLAEIEENYAVKLNELNEVIRRMQELEQENKALASELKIIRNIVYNPDPTGLQIHYEKYLKRQPQTQRREIWEDLLAKVISMVDEKTKSICENIQFEGREILKELDRLKDNQKALIEILIKIHNDITVFSYY